MNDQPPFGGVWAAMVTVISPPSRAAPRANRVDGRVRFMVRLSVFCGLRPVQPAAFDSLASAGAAAKREGGGPVRR